MTDSGTDATEPVNLHCFQGGPAPETLLEGWSSFAQLSGTARSELWGVFEPVLLQPTNPAARERLSEFLRARSADASQLVRAMGACEFMFRQASSLDLAPELVEQDIECLNGGPGPAVELASDWFRRVHADLRRTVVHASLNDHGKVLVAVDWRMDKIVASDRGVNLSTPVVFLTLKYQEHDEINSVTLQLTEDRLRDLKKFCDRLVE